MLQPSTGTYEEVDIVIRKHNVTSIRIIAGRASTGKTEICADSSDMLGHTSDTCKLRKKRARERSERSCTLTKRALREMRRDAGHLFSQDGNDAEGSEGHTCSECVQDASKGKKKKGEKKRDDRGGDREEKRE